MVALPLQKRGLYVGKTKRGKGTKWMVLVDGASNLLGAYLDSASSSEVKLLEKTLETIKVKRSGPGRPRTRPERLIANRGYDSNKVRKALKKRHMEPIIPVRCNNKVATDQDGRKLRRYRRRWIVERFIGWLGNFRRITIRWDGTETLLAMQASFIWHVHSSC